MMTRHELGKAKDQDLVTSLAAMKRAAAMARKSAVQTDTAIVVVQGDKIIRRTSKEILMNARMENPQITPISTDLEQRNNLRESAKSADEKTT